MRQEPPATRPPDFARLDDPVLCLMLSWLLENRIKIKRVRVAWRDDRALIYGDVRAGWLCTG